MKTRIKKIIIMAVALLFVSVGVSFAQDLKGNSKKAPGNAYGHYNKGYDTIIPAGTKDILNPNMISEIDIVTARFLNSAITTIALRHVKETLSDLK